MPATARLRRMITFQERTCIDIRLLLAAKKPKKLIDFVELGFDDMVVVISPCISCYSTGFWRSAGRAGSLSLKIIERQHNDGTRARQNLLWIATLLFPEIGRAHV